MTLVSDEDEEQQREEISATSLDNRFQIKIWDTSTFEAVKTLGNPVGR